MKKRLSFLVISALILLFAFSAYKVLDMRFKEGDVYPRYSSLRHDPMGTSIFFQSLGKMDYTVTTLLEESLLEGLDPGDTILFILSPSFNFSKEAREGIVGFILHGGRVLLTEKDHNSLMDFFDTRIDPNQRDWENDGDENNRGILKAEPGEMFDFLDEKLTIMDLSPLISEWPRTQTVYSIKDKDIVLLLTHGKGDMIICSETYFISNESLIKEPPVRFFTWIMDGRKQVLVDEYHHGISSRKGISFLLEKYHLYWSIAYMILIFILYLWHVLPRFRKPIPRSLSETPRIRSSLDGYTHILTKTVPKDRLLDISLEQWIKSSRNRLFVEKNRPDIDLLKHHTKSKGNERDEDILNLYNEISCMIKDKRKLI